MKHVFSAAYARPQETEPPKLDGISRDNFVQLLKKIRRHLPNPPGKAAMNTFAIMTSVTRISAWVSEGEEPCCYMAQTEIARLAECTASRIRAHEAELVAAGLIYKHTLGNGGRSGWQDRGIYFTPAIERLEEFRLLEAQMEAQRKEAARLRGLRSTHKRHLSGVIAELADCLGSDHADVLRLSTALNDWPSADRLHSMDLEALTEHERAGDNLCREAWEILRNCEESIAQPLVFERSYIQDTTQNPNSEECNASLPKRTSGKPDDINQFEDTPTGASGREKDYGAETAAHKSEFVEKLGPDRLYHLASPDMKTHLDVRRYRSGALHFHDFVIAADARLPELGINRSAWEEAKRIMGEDTATMCILILDASRDRPGLPVKNPGGYLRGMTRAAERGQLNLIGSLIGLSERKKHEND
ncbi:plasmid replication protein RepC_soli-2a (plasmid) [Phaeobacter inhibens]|uniref:replication initiation protein RepC n=1 Tax=Phaeobacter inhibens TaxID=221822 RepID=UPI000C9C4E9E|nr:replication initiation protein RepC [Phaeobacter inhibens]AUQ52619.1 plasmid replication protein RepC_soli-2a [Phaeobacter inhibens]AUR22424.1 plasmid replication protein RepC_soli-2a [Phaeobacter inhibens]